MCQNASRPSTTPLTGRDPIRYTCMQIAANWLRLMSTSGARHSQPYASSTLRTGYPSSRSATDDGAIARFWWDHEKRKRAWPSSAVRNRF